MGSLPTDVSQCERSQRICSPAGAWDGVRPGCEMDGDRRGRPGSGLPESTEPAPHRGEARPNDGPGTSETEEPPLDTSPNVLEIDFDSVAGGRGRTRSSGRCTPILKPPAHEEKRKDWHVCRLQSDPHYGRGLSHLAIDPARTPTLYKLQTEGFYFTNFYTPIWSVLHLRWRVCGSDWYRPKSGVWSFTAPQRTICPSPCAPS